LFLACAFVLQDLLTKGFLPLLCYGYFVTANINTLFDFKISLKSIFKGISDTFANHSQMGFEATLRRNFWFKSLARLKVI